MNTDGITLLLIEDNAEYARLVREYVALESPGEFDLEVVSRLSTGIELLLRGGIDVVLLDLNLPDSHGLDTYVTVRTQAPDVATIVLTGLDDEGLALAAAREGAQDYLVKGRVSGDGLVRCLRYAYERQQALVQLKRYARALSAAESRSRRIIENNADAIVIADAAERVIFVNPSAEALFGAAAAELVGRAFEHPLREDRTSEILVEGPPEKIVEMRVVPTSWDGQPVRMALLRDVTERRKAAELRARLEAEALAVQQLRDLDRMKTDFVRNVTDELVAPLPPLQTAVDHLLDGSLGEMTPPQLGVLQTLQRHLRDLSRFADGVYALSRLDSGRYDLHPAQLELIPVLEAEMEQLRAMTAHRDVSMKLDLQAGVRVQADADAVRRVIRHLVDNAVTHNPQGTEIRVRARQIGDQTVEVAVVDTGRGIPADQRDRVFDAFYQTTPDGSTLGSGIGLALCKALVERMGGEIEVESSPGEGAEVRFTLPAVAGA